MQTKVKKERERETEEEKKKGKESQPRVPRTQDGIATPCGFYSHPNTHKHPNVTLSLGIPFEFSVIMNVKSWERGEAGRWGWRGGGRSVILQVHTREAIFIA